MKKKLVIIGDSAFAEVAFEYFTYDSQYEVKAFAVEKEFLVKKELFNLPVVELESLRETYSPKDHEVFVALTYGKLNRNRTRLLEKALEMGYEIASYISSKAFVWKNVEVGKNCFIFENNVVQPFVKIGDNSILWSGNHIGHHSIIGKNAFISSHVVISGFVTIDDNVFLGVNSTVSNNVTVAKDTWVGPGVVISKDTKEAELYKPQSTLPSPISTHRFFKVS